MYYFLVWGFDSKDEHTVEVHSLDELSRCVGDIEKEAKMAKKPVLLELVAVENRGAPLANGSALAIGLGRDHSVLSFSGSNNNVNFIAKDSIASSSTTWFLYGGSQSEFCSENIIPIEKAKAAFEYFFQSGKLLRDISWDGGPGNPSDV